MGWATCSDPTLSPASPERAGSRSGFPCAEGAARACVAAAPERQSICGAGSERAAVSSLSPRACAGGEGVGSGMPEGLGWLFLSSTLHLSCFRAPGREDKM